jgi:hypothetical protein
MAKIYFTRTRNVLIALFFLPYLVSAQSISRIGNSPYPLSATPDTLYMVHMGAMSRTQQLSVVTLQGLLARVKPQIMVDYGATGYINDLSANYGVTYDSTYFTDFNGLINHFKQHINGYIVCADTNNSFDTTVDAAISVCAFMNGIATAPQDTATLDSLGLAQLYNTGGKGWLWAFDTFQTSYSKKIITIQDPTKCMYVSDYSVFAGAYDFYDFPADSRSALFLSSIGVNGAVFGWYDDEQVLVNATSGNSLHMHASDFSSNLSVYSNFSIAQQHQVNHTDDTILRPGVHTVCFMMTDGDNIQWLGGGFENVPNWYGNPHRGEINLGWTISPALAELGPTQMKYIYDSAATTATGRDYFVAAPSGMGYSYPDVFAMPDSGAAITSRMMQKADLSILNVIADNYSAASLAPYLNEPNIDAILYYPYNGNYWQLQGFTDCINGKPVISARFNLVQPDFSTYSLARAIDSMPKDPYSSDGYSLVAVNVWSSTVDSVIKCIQMLDSNVRVVTPESFVKLYMAGNNCIPAIPAGISTVSTASGVTVYNDPNPCNGHTEIVYSLPHDSQVKAVLYDQYGEQVETIFSNYSTSGTHQVGVDTRNLSAGLYYYTLQGDYFRETRKCLVMR